MKKIAVIATFVAAVVCSCLVTSVAVADCGKMMIYPYRWRFIPPAPRPYIYERTRTTTETERIKVTPVPPPCPEKPRDWTPAPITTPRSIEENQTPQYTENVPEATGSVSADAYASASASAGGGVRYGTFKETHQQAVIAWNGLNNEEGEETLILTTNEISTAGGGAMLSVLPLPGKPIEIARSDKDIFKKAKKLLYEKLQSSSTKYGVIMSTVIGSHNIFVWELDNVATFKNDVNAYIAHTYKGQAAALIDNQTEEILQAYIDRGFRYFAFDLTQVNEKNSTKEAISYRFKSKFVYFPLQISGIGGTASETAVDLIVITPDLIEVTGGAVKIGDGDNDVRVLGMKTVEFTRSEVVGLDKALAAVFKRGETSLKVRNFYFDGTLNGYNSDFIAK